MKLLFLTFFPSLVTVSSHTNLILAVGVFLFIWDFCQSLFIIVLIKPSKLFCFFSFLFFLCQEVIIECNIYDNDAKND